MKSLLRLLAINLFRLFPLSRNKIVFNAYNGQGFGCNPKYIALAILRRSLPWDLVWLVNDPASSFPPGIRAVKRHGIRAFYELATARIIVNNVKMFLPFRKRPGQYYIQTWHGDMPMKYIEKEAESSLSAHYLRQTREESSYTDLLLSGSRFMSEIYKASFWYDGEIFEAGLPRNDLFFGDLDYYGKKVRDHFHFPFPSRILLYAPTFRDDGSEFAIPDFGAVLDILNKRSGGDWRVIVRVHPNDLGRLKLEVSGERIADGSAYPDAQELAAACDLLITDYSSIILEFSLMRKGVLLYTPDLEAYTAIRPLRPVYRQLPFPHFTSSKDLDPALDAVFSTTYKDSVERFLTETIHSFDHGIAADRVVDRMEQVIQK